MVDFCTAMISWLCISTTTKFWLQKKEERSVSTQSTTQQQQWHSHITLQLPTLFKSKSVRFANGPDGGRRLDSPRAEMFTEYSSPQDYSSSPHYSPVVASSGGTAAAAAALNKPTAAATSILKAKLWSHDRLFRYVQKKGGFLRRRQGFSCCRCWPGHATYVPGCGILQASFQGFKKDIKFRIIPKLSSPWFVADVMLLVFSFFSLFFAWARHFWKQQWAGICQRGFVVIGESFTATTDYNMLS